MENVYLIPAEDATYRAQICENKPTKDAICLTKEGTYPTELYYVRHDLNMCSELHNVDVKNRDELLRILNSLGKCRNGIDELWSYDNSRNTTRAAKNLFDKCYERKADIFYEEMRRILE